MATASVTQLSKIEREEGAGIALGGLLRILMRRTYRGDPNYNDLAGLTDQELVTIANQASNVHTAALTGLETVGTLVSSYDPSKCEFDHNCVGWLTCHLSETAREMKCIEWSAREELVRRGYDSIGLPLRQRAQA